MRDLFWRQGYVSTSVSGLVDATGLQPGSLYAAFGNKEGAMLAVVDHYGERSIAGARELLLAEDTSPRRGLEKFFENLIERTLADPEGRGCLLVNTLLETSGYPDGEAVSARARQYLQGMEELFRLNLSRARKAGELQSKRSPRDLAVFLIGTVWSVRVLARMNPTKARLNAIVRPALAAVF